MTDEITMNYTHGAVGWVTKQHCEHMTLNDTSLIEPQLNVIVRERYWSHTQGVLIIPLSKLRI